jgi:hypothetical protein
MNLDDAHKLSMHNRQAVQSSQLCGCFYCLKTFPPTDVVEWVDEEDTALCPKCGIDSVIGSAPDIEITQDFLKSMKKRWF